MTEQVCFLLKIVEETSSALVASRARELRLAIQEDADKLAGAVDAVVPDAEVVAMEPGAVARLVVEELRSDAKLCAELQELVARSLTMECEVLAGQLLERELKPGGKIAELVRSQLESKPKGRGR